MGDFAYKVTMIVPIYNMEKFLRGCLDSLVAQTIAPEEMEVLMIDDGSPDNCISIMEEYAAAHPTFKILRKTNGGLSDTRNYGIAHAQGKYLMYLDADDTLTPETVKSVTDYFDKHYDEVDLVTYMEYPVVDGVRKKPHYRFRTLIQSGIYDLNRIENAFITQTRINVCVKNLGEENVLFDTNREFRHEDQKYCTQVLQRKMKIGYCNKGAYLYLHQPESIVRTYFYAYYIFEPTMKFWEDLFADYPDTVPKYIQALYVNDINWKTIEDKLLPYHYDAERFQEAKNRILALLERIDDDVILMHPTVDTFHKQYWIAQKSGNQIRMLSGPNEIVITNHDQVIYENKKIEIVLRTFKVKNNHITFVGFIKSPLFNYYDRPTLYMIKNGKYEKPIEVPITESSWSYYRAKQKTNHFWLFRMEFDADKIKSFEFRVKVGERIYNTSYFFMPDVIFNHKAKRYSYFKDGKEYYYRTGCFYVKKATEEDTKADLVKRKKKYSKKSRKVWLIRNAVLLNIKKFSNVWLYYDCKGVGKDNAYYQFDHDFGKQDGVRRYYVINEDDFKAQKKNFPANQRKYLVKFGSYFHKYLYLKAQKIITAFIEKNNYSPFTNKVFAQYIDVATQPDLIYLQHGVLHAHLPWKYSQDRLGVDKEVISTRFEEENLTQNYCFTKKHLIASGMPRYDYIDAEQPSVNRILFAPSWRKYLVGMSGTEWVTTEGKFRNSLFFEETQRFLNSPELQELLEKYDYYLDFKLHPILKRYEHMYTITNPRVTLAESKVKETEYKIFMTDFSSFVFDFVYLKRAIIYFVPDDEMFRAGMNDYRELDMPLEDGFGRKTTTSEETVEAIAEILKNNGMPEEKYQKKMDGMFFYYDEGQRDRIYEALIKD